MSTHVSVPVPTADFLKLVDFLREQGSERDPVETVAYAIDYWIENARRKREGLLPETVRSESRGFTWKNKDSSVFLPHGTEVRMRYKDQNYYAKVVDDDIVYEGKPVSPASLANTITNSSRNAWRDLWIKRPVDKSWVLADDLRRPTLTLKDLGLE
jgi:hypothetical protein